MTSPLIAFLALSLAPPAEVVVRPATAPGPLDNPLKGWCPYTNAGPISQPYSMVFLYASWKDLEPEEGRFAFDRWEERAWTAPAAAGKHVVFRVSIDYPRKPTGLPDWLAKQGVNSTRYEAHGGGLSPDYDDPRMIDAMERLIAALGRRYDANPRVAFIQLGLLGHWGEWHTYPREELYAKPETERRVVDAYHRAFPHKLLMARVARDDAGRRDWLGYHDDMFPADTDNGQPWSFLAKMRSAGRSDNWKRAAIGGEMEPGAAAKWLGPAYPQTLAMAERAHVSWVGPYCPALGSSKDRQLRENSEALVRRMGYQFRLTEVRHPVGVDRGGMLGVSIRGENEGVAPFSYPWPVELALLDASGRSVATLPLRADPRSWLPGPFAIGESVKLDAPPGRYSLALGLRDPWTNRPAVAFANDLPRREGWTILSTVEVAPAR